MSVVPSITDAVPAGASVCIDTSVLLAYLTGAEAISGLAEELVDRCLATGRNPGSISAVSATELLVRPYRAGPSAVSTVEGFLRHFSDLRVVPIDYAVANEAARIRAATALSTPDALIVASHVVDGSDVLITNDASWPGRLRGAVLDTVIIVMRDLLPVPSASRPSDRHR